MEIDPAFSIVNDPVIKEPVKFDASSTEVLKDGESVSPDEAQYLWKIAGTEYEGLQTQHDFDQIGNYTAELTAKHPQSNADVTVEEEFSVLWDNTEQRLEHLETAPTPEQVQGPDRLGQTIWGFRDQDMITQIIPEKTLEKRRRSYKAIEPFSSFAPLDQIIYSGESGSGEQFKVKNLDQVVDEIESDMDQVDTIGGEIPVYKAELTPENPVADFFEQPRMTYAAVDKDREIINMAVLGDVEKKTQVFGRTALGLDENIKEDISDYIDSELFKRNGRIMDSAGTTLNPYRGLSEELGEIVNPVTTTDPEHEHVKYLGFGVAPVFYGSEEGLHQIVNGPYGDEELIEQTVEDARGKDGESSFEDIYTDPVKIERELDDLNAFDI